ncbi:MAG TPA: phosphodiester glycosidase family protein [Solirubrobacterales bacterium]|nr:phosphodiester glycosidase family protein [Solirubrobacterales bacterium]
MPQARPERRYVPIPLWRRARRILLLAAVACLIPTGISYVSAMTEKHNVGLGVSSVEWLRQHGGNALVSQIENWYYTLNAPEKGGPPLRSLPQVGLTSAPGSGESASKPAYRPPRVTPIIHPALPGEGVWKPAAKGAGPQPPVLLTTFRSDPEYPQFVAGVAWIDSTRTHLSYVPGLAEPPPPLSHRGPSEVPGPLRKRVVATFNGGFPLETSNAGLIYRGRVKEAMVNGIGTVVEYRDGRVDIVRWHRGPQAPPNVWFAKQNLPPIIYEDRLNPNLSDGPEWGETVNNAVRVWRSGLGIDRRGNLIYAAANNQTVESLAKIMQRAGAVRALELDINEDWTSFISYRRPGAVSPGNLLPEMFRPAERYLTPDERDFFAVYLRAGKRW